MEVWVVKGSHERDWKEGKGRLYTRKSSKSGLAYKMAGWVCPSLNVVVPRHRRLAAFLVEDYKSRERKRTQLFRLDLRLHFSLTRLKTYASCSALRVVRYTLFHRCGACRTDILRTGRKDAMHIFHEHVTQNLPVSLKADRTTAQRPHSLDDHTARLHAPRNCIITTAHR